MSHASLVDQGGRGLGPWWPWDLETPGYNLGAPWSFHFLMCILLYYINSSHYLSVKIEVLKYFCTHYYRKNVWDCFKISKSTQDSRKIHILKLKNATASGAQRGPQIPGLQTSNCKLNQKNKFVKMARIFYIEIDILLCAYINLSLNFQRKSIRKSQRMYIWQLKMQQLMGST